MSTPFEFRNIEPREKLVEGNHPFADELPRDEEEADNPSPYGSKNHVAPYRPMYETIYGHRAGKLSACGLASFLLAASGYLAMFLLPAAVGPIVRFSILLSMVLIGIILGAVALVCGMLDLNGMKLGAVSKSGWRGTLIAVLTGGLGVLGCLSAVVLWIVAGAGGGN